MRMQHRVEVTARRKPGNPGKGARKAITIRVPDELSDVIEEAATQAGYLSVSDYLNAVLADVHHTAVPAYAHPVRRHETDSLLDDDMLRAG
jgi:hypothetical protein